MKIYCHSQKCSTGTSQEHEEVSPSLDKRDGWKVNGIKSHGGCRDSATDYRTVRCLNCGTIHTSDFSHD